MRVALWDSHRHAVEADLAGGDALAGQTRLGRLYRFVSHQLFPLDRHPVPLELAYLAAVLRRLHHTVEYFEDEPPAGDVVIFRPRLASLAATFEAIDQTRRRMPQTRCWATGAVAARWPHWFTQRGATVLKGDVEQLLWSLDRVLACDKPIINLGELDDLDALPWPEWSWFDADRFRLPGHFCAIPVAQVQHSRGRGGRESISAASAELSSLRYRSAERVVSELRHQIDSGGFEAFVFCDPRFAAHRQQAWRLAQLVGRLPQQIRFSVHCRPEDIDDDLLAALADVGLSLAAFTVDLPCGELPPSASIDRYAAFVARCRRYGVRTAALLKAGDGLPTEIYRESSMTVAGQINATSAEFFWQPPVSASLDQLRTFSLGWVNRYYLRLDYAWQQWRLLMPEADRTSPSLSEMPHADAAHPDTPKPLGGIELIQRTRGLRKDSPHQRAPARGKRVPPSPHE
jgi:hypothetical protein